MSTIEHVPGEPWTREQIEGVAGQNTDPRRFVAALKGRTSQRYRRFEAPATRGRIRWLIEIEAAVAMRDTARPENRAAWEAFVQRLMETAPPPVEGEPDHSAWMPQQNGEQTR